MELPVRKYHPHFNYQKLDFPETIFEENRALLTTYKGFYTKNIRNLYFFKELIYLADIQNGTPQNSLKNPWLQ